MVGDSVPRNPFSHVHTLVLLEFSLKSDFRRPHRTHHVSEVCTESACGLVVLHHTVVIQDLSTAVTVRQTHTYTENMILHIVLQKQRSIKWQI